MVSPRAIAVAVWPVATLMLVYKILQATENPQGYDTVPLLNAVRALIHGGDIYTSTGAFDFLYPPSALAISLPLGLVPVDAAKMIVFASNLVGILVGSAILIRVFDQPLTGLAGAPTVLGLSLASPYSTRSKLGTSTELCCWQKQCSLAQPRGVRGTWPASAWVEPCVETGAGSAHRLTDPVSEGWDSSHRARNPCVHVGPCARKRAAITRFLQRHRPPVPSRSKRGASGSQRFASKRLGALSLPDILILTLRVAAVVAVLVVLWERFKDRTGEPPRMIELGSVALIGAFLTATFTWTYYSLFLLPLAISVLTPRSSMRWWVSWVGVYCVFTSDVWTTERLPNLANDLLSGMFACGLAILMCSIWVHSYRTRHSVSTRGGCEPG